MIDSVKYDISFLTNKTGKTRTDLKNDVVNRKPYLGIRYPELKEIAKEISKLDPIEFLKSSDLSIYEFEIIQTYVIGSLKDINEAIKYFELFIPKAKEWSVVDSLCQKFIIAKKYQSEVWNVLNKYKEINDEYTQRIVAVTILSHFLNDNYIDRSIDILDKLRNEGYFTKMAVAWAFATIMAKYPDKCIKYLKTNTLDTWTHNKAIQKMIESYRVSEENKIIIRELKR